MSGLAMRLPLRGGRGRIVIQLLQALDELGGPGADSDFLSLHGAGQLLDLGGHA